MALKKTPAHSEPAKDEAKAEAKIEVKAPEFDAPKVTPASVAHYAVPMSKAYGASTKEEHRRSGYIMPDSFYEPESEEIAQHKAPGNQHNEK